MFDSMGNFVTEPVSFGWLLLVIAVAGVALFIYSRVNHRGYEKIEDAVKQAASDAKAHAVVTWPKIEADLLEQIKNAQSKVNELIARYTSK